MKTTTLRDIIKFGTCYSQRRINEYIEKYGKDTEITFKQIFDEIGIEDAAWCLHVLEYKETCLFSADVAESVLHIYEKKYPHCGKVRDLIDGVRKFKNNEITLDGLEELRACAGLAVAVAVAAAVADDYTGLAVAAAVAAASRRKQWKIVEKIFINHFCNE